MTHDEVEELLGAYALDATSTQEREEIERHLATCPRCRAEAATHQETAAMMAVGLAGRSPEGLWERIAAATFQAEPRADAALPLPPLRPVPVPGTARPRRFGGAARRFVWVATAAAAVALAVAGYFGVEVGQLRSQVHVLGRQVASASLAEAAAAVVAGPHATVSLDAADGTPAGRVVVAATGGVAYWLPSRLAELPDSRTYQLWGLVDGRPVSLAILGPDPRTMGRFRFGTGTSKLMVTAEPAGGTPAPTTAVLAVGTVPASAA